MPSYSGSCSRTAAGGAAAALFPCGVDIADDTLTLLPASGAPLVLDLGDIDEISPADYELRLKLYTGETLALSRFGKSFQDLDRDLQEAHRKRLVQCLLLEDLEEIARFDGSARLQTPAAAFFAAAEIRLYGSNLALLPQGQVGFQWRLADIDSVSFDDSSYAIVLRSGEDTLTLTRLAKRTGELRERLQSAMTEVARRSALAVRNVFPFLAPDQFQRVAGIMKDGHVASLSRLASIHVDAVAALTQRIVRARLKPYYDALMERAAGGGGYAGFKLIRKEAEIEAIGGTADDVQAAAAVAEEPDAPGLDDSINADHDQELLHWFIVPLRPRTGAGAPVMAAWESTSRSGRATYFFRLMDSAQAAALKDAAEIETAVDRAVRQLNTTLLMLNFRREPIYLPDASLQNQPIYRRYAIACRKIPALVRLRSSYAGRALHTSLAAWQQQVQGIMEKTG